MKKRALCILMAVLMLLSVSASAVTLEPWLQSVADKKDADLVDMDKTLDITWLGWNSNGILPKDDTDMQTIVEKRFNIKVSNVPVDCYNTEQWNLMLNTATDFDICTTALSFAEMAEDEIIRPVPLEMIETYAPTLVSLLKEQLGDSWMDYCAYNGEYWGIPQITASWACPNILGIRADWLNAIGYDETNLPTTMEGLEEMLLKLHTEDPDGNGQEDTYAIGMSNGCGFYEYGAYGIAKNYWYYKNGQLMTAPADPDLKDALKLMQRWYKLGIYDPEILTDKRADGVAKYANGIIAGYESLDNCLQTTVSAANLSGPAAAAKEGRDQHMIYIKPMEGCATVMYSIPVSTKGIVFGYNCSDEKMIRLLQIQDTYFKDLDLWLADNFGEKGVNWDFDENGNILRGYEYGYAERKAEADSGFQHFYNFNFMPDSVLAWRQGGVGREHSRVTIFTMAKDWPVVEPATVSLFKTEADIEYSDAAGKVYDEYYMKAVMGEVDIDATFDDFQAQWLAAGGQEILEAKRALETN